MPMLLELPLLPGKSPTLNVFTIPLASAAINNTPVNGSPIAGTVVASRSANYTFDLTGIATGTYYVYVTNPLAYFRIRITANDIYVGDYLGDLPLDVTSIAVTVSPEAFLSLDNTMLQGSRLKFFNNETRVIAVTKTTGVFDGSSMDFVIEKKDKTSLVEVLGLTSTTNSVNVTIPTTVYQDDCQLTWSLRKSSSGEVLLYGPAQQQYAAVKG